MTSPQPQSQLCNQHVIDHFRQTAGETPQARASDISGMLALIDAFNVAAQLIADTAENLNGRDVPSHVRDHMRVIATQAESIMQNTSALTTGLYSLNSNFIEEMRAHKRAQEEREELENQAMRDPLTGAYNRRYFDMRMAEMFADASAKNAPLAILMIDVDHFKSVNDNYGHPSGDAVLQDLKKLLDVSTRRSDLVARFGGEEFVIAIKGGPVLTMKIAERLRKNVENRAPRQEEKMHIPGITVSIGVAHMALAIHRNQCSSAPTWVCMKPKEAAATVWSAHRRTYLSRLQIHHKKGRNFFRPFLFGTADFDARRAGRKAAIFLKNPYRPYRPYHLVA